jgi:hypothetical protein
MKILYLSYDGILEPLGQSQVLRHRMGKTGREKVERQYSLQVTGPKLAMLLKSLAGKS